MKKILLTVLALVIVFALTACSGGNNQTAPVQTGSDNETQSDQGEPAGEKRLIKLGFAYDDSHENYLRIEAGMRKQIEGINASRDDIVVELYVTDAQGDLNKQLSDVESLIVQGVEAILISPVDLEGSIPACQAATAAGVLVFDDRGIDQQYTDVRIVGQDEWMMGEMTKAWLIAQLEADPDLSYKVVALYGTPEHIDQMKRVDAVLTIGDEMPERFELLDSQYGNWVEDRARTVTEDWIQRFSGDFNLIVSGSDAMSQGASNAGNSAGILDKLTIVSYDGTATGLQLLKDGLIDTTILMNMDLGGAMRIDVMLDAALNGVNTSEVNFGEKVLELVDSTNIDRIYAETAI